MTAISTRLPRPIKPQLSALLTEFDFSDLEPGMRVVVAMSGGVDSTMVAAALARYGCEVIGVTLRLNNSENQANRENQASPQKSHTNTANSRSCCAERDELDARRAAEQLGIDHYVFDYHASFFDNVIKPFADSYAKGETPIPCIECNDRVKFADLLVAARQLEASALATGHYACRANGFLCQPTDHERDQSYFLYRSSAEQIEFLRFPLATMTKPRLREIARSWGLKLADKPDSHDICFVGRAGYRALVASLQPESACAGDIAHIDGRVLGRHNGIIGYTIGQRRGIGIGGNQEPLYVVSLDHKANRVIVGPRQALEVESIELRALNLLVTRSALEATPQLRARYRSSMESVAAHYDRNHDTVHFAHPQLGVSPGQACVFYSGPRMLGGGVIKTCHRAR